MRNPVIDPLNYFFQLVAYVIPQPVKALLWVVFTVSLVAFVIKAVIALTG